MAPPFSGVPTQHIVIVDETKYFANCAWDSIGGHHLQASYEGGDGNNLTLTVVR